VFLFLTESPLSLAWVLSLAFRRHGVFLDHLHGACGPAARQIRRLDALLGLVARSARAQRQIFGRDRGRIHQVEYLTNVKNLALICQAKYKFVGLAFAAPPRPSCVISVSCCSPADVAPRASTSPRPPFCQNAWCETYGETARFAQQYRRGPELPDDLRMLRDMVRRFVDTN
jgi:hypothetical protein